MKFETFIAKRYLFKGRKSSFISIISLVSTIGITIGVAALVIALSLINGFQNDIRNKILNSTAHIMITSVMGESLADHEEVTRTIKSNIKEVTIANPVIYGTVLLKGSARNATGAIMRGVNLNSNRKSVWQKRLKRGKLPLKRNEILIGHEMAARANLFQGDTCTIITPQPVLTPGGIIPRNKRMKVAGIFSSGLYELDNGTILTNLETAQRLFKLKDNISYIQIYLKDLFDADRVAKKLETIIPKHLSVLTWKELNASLYSALKLEKTILFFTLTLIIIVASLNIIAGLILLVIQKMKDIGILLSYGATAKMIKRIFFIQGGIIGILGTTFGVALGLGFCTLANKFQLIKVPSEIYQMSHVPFNINPFDLAAIIVVSLVISFTATLIPSKKAASVNVIDAIKNE